MPLCLTPRLDRKRLRTPAGHLAVLVEPPAEALRAALEHGLAPAWERVTWAERPLADWRAELRAELGLPRGPIVVTGHQCEFFHAGVFAKTLAAAILAEAAHGSAAFLEVDSDLPKQTHLGVPEITSHGLRRVDVPIPGIDPRRPVEALPPQPREAWLEFFVRVASVYEHYEASLLPAFTDAWLTCPGQTIHLSEGLSRGWAALEQALGFQDVRRVRLSCLCETKAFFAFLTELLLHAERVAEDYNAAQADYRRRYRVRSPNRPLPPLTRAGTRIESPFWVWREDGPRERLFVERAGQGLVLLAGREPVGSLPSSPAETLEALRRLVQAGWRVRPRASTLAAFARLALADLFIHGLGGAKYDEITDAWLARRFGLEPPRFGCVTATLHLPLPRTGTRFETWRKLCRQSRDIRYNPQRYLPDLPETLLHRREEMIRKSRELRENQPNDHALRRAVWEEIRRINEQLLEHNPWRVAEIDQQVHALEEKLRLDRIALDREYFTALHLHRTLADLARRLRSDLSS